MMLGKRRMRYPVLMAAFSLCAVSFSTATQNQSKMERFKSTDNAVTKRQIINEIGSERARMEVGSDKTRKSVVLMEEDIALLRQALDDSKPTVVEATIRHAGELKVVELEDKMIALFQGADKKFQPGYRDGVKASVIIAVGQCNGPKSTKFISDIMLLDENALYIKFILQAVQEMKNPSLLGVTKILRENLEGKLRQKKEAGTDPILLSELQRNIKFAKEVESTLTGNNGGAK